MSMVRLSAAHTHQKCRPLKLAERRRNTRQPPRVLEDSLDFFEVAFSIGARDFDNGTHPR
jgi:hypothetical protein